MISRWYFAEDGYEIYTVLKRTCWALALLIRSFCFATSSCRRRSPSCFSKVPYHQLSDEVICSSEANLRGIFVPVCKYDYHYLKKHTMDAHQRSDWLFVTRIMPLIRSAKPSQSLPKLGTLFRQVSGRPLTKVRLTAHPNPDKFFTENEPFENVDILLWIPFWVRWWNPSSAHA